MAYDCVYNSCRHNIYHGKRQQTTGLYQSEAAPT
ncbi:hypothetical protein M2262_002453 [Pseudomonas sp. BIGb0408]|uniref:Uncharacterized protein n=1 Tax=Phytopseudomonas flavescens TaxID=29435 RepID=A0A7Z0BQD1_9GAMM|nr:hypothetical protein [Pseudomonas sp. BIGb0408]NYH73026.1 hypothetical protein [Pseudomonas flavescens]